MLIYYLGIYLSTHQTLAINQLLRNLPLKMDTLRLVLRVRISKDRESLYYYFIAKYCHQRHKNKGMAKAGQHPPY